MTATQRLRGIEQRTKALGFAYKLNKLAPRQTEFVIGNTVFTCGFRLCKASLRAAERLLALYEPGPVVEISGIPYQHMGSPDMGMKLTVNLSEVKSAMVRVKEPGTYKLVKVENSDDSETAYGD